MYKLINNKEQQAIAVLKIDQPVWIQIPFDPDNTDYQKYLAWVAEGNTPEPADQGE